MIKKSFNYSTIDKTCCMKRTFWALLSFPFCFNAQWNCSNLVLGIAILTSYHIAGKLVLVQLTDVWLITRAIVVAENHLRIRRLRSGYGLNSTQTQFFTYVRPKIVMISRFPFGPIRIRERERLPAGPHIFSFRPCARCNRRFWKLFWRPSLQSSNHSAVRFFASSPPFPSHFFAHHAKHHPQTVSLAIK